MKITVVRPKGATGALRVFTFFHGGGWILGDYPTHERFVRDLVVDTGYADHRGLLGRVLRGPGDLAAVCHAARN